MLTTEELAAALRISGRQVQRLRAAGLPYLSVGARRVRYDLPACQTWLQANVEHVTACLSAAPQRAASRSMPASVVSAFTAACRRAQLRVTPSESNPN